MLSRDAKTEAGVFLLTLVDDVLHALAVKHATVNLFLSTHGDEWPGLHQEERVGGKFDIKARARGIITLQRACPRSKMEQQVKDKRAAGWNTSWREIVL